MQQLDVDHYLCPVIWLIKAGVGGRDPDLRGHSGLGPGVGVTLACSRRTLLTTDKHALGFSAVTEAASLQADVLTKSCSFMNSFLLSSGHI
jgi:hypothetical protein